MEGDTRRAARRIRGTERFWPARSVMLVVASIALAATVAWLAAAPGEIDAAQRRMLFILVLAALLWVSEAIPAFAVGLLVIALQIALLGNYARGGEGSGDWQTYVAVLGHPLVWLFFGGFVLGAALHKSGLDRRVASLVLARTGSAAPRLLMGVMLVTAALSMFMSNSATAAMMVPIALSLAAGFGNPVAVRRRLLLGVVLGANLGGMATLIGSPPNAIAVSALAVGAGSQVSFLQWTLLGLPPAMLLFLLGWLWLLRLVPATEDGAAPATMTGATDSAGMRPGQTRLVLVTLVITVLLWATGSWTGVPTAAVSFVPIVALTAGGILVSGDIRQLPWEVLLLIAGGIALGDGVRGTGLADWLVGLLPLEDVPLFALALAIGVVTVLVSNVMSNTAAANIIVPLAASAAAGSGAAILLVVPAALCASCAMALPISTPPNALAFASGELRSRDLLALGALMGLAAPFVTTTWVWMITPVL